LLKLKPGKQPELEVVESIQVGGTIDNPSYFADPFAPETGRDVSGYALASLARAAAFPDPDNMDSVTLWLVQSSEASKDAEADFPGRRNDESIGCDGCPCRDRSETEWWGRSRRGCLSQALWERLLSLPR